MPITFSTNSLDTRDTFLHDQATVITGHALATTIDTGQVDNYFARQSPSGVGDKFSQSTGLIRAGTYIFSAEGQTNSANGSIDWALDGVAFVTGQDWYAAAQNKNVVKTANVTIASDGYHVLTGTVNGKNASSSGYNADLTKYWVRQASD